jgi:hypothetical protein
MKLRNFEILNITLKKGAGYVASFVTSCDRKLPVISIARDADIICDAIKVA